MSNIYHDPYKNDVHTQVDIFRCPASVPKPWSYFEPTMFHFQHTKWRRFNLLKQNLVHFLQKSCDSRRFHSALHLLVYQEEYIDSPRLLKSYSKECEDSPRAPYELSWSVKMVLLSHFLKRMSFLETWLFWFYNILWYIISWCKDTKIPKNGSARINQQFASMQQLYGVVLSFSCFNYLLANPFKMVVLVKWDATKYPNLVHHY